MRPVWVVTAVLMAAFAAPASAAPAPVRATVAVTGRAGEVATFRLDRTARLGNAGGDTTVTAPGAPWAGIAITRLDAPASRAGLDTYVHYVLRDGLLCPGRRCEPPAFVQPTAAFDDDGGGYAVLQPGTYGVALLGPAGARVRVDVRFRGVRAGRSAVPTARRAAAYVAKQFDPAVGNGDTMLASRGFARVRGAGRAVVDSLAVAFVLEESAAVQLTMCGTTGGRRDLDSTPGGVTPCADHSGFDVLFGPHAYPMAVPVEEDAVGITYTASAGRAHDGGSGAGYEAHVAGVAGRTAAVYVGVAF